MRARWITIAVTVGLFAASLAGIRLIPEQFFPSSDRAELLVDLKLQDNASILATRDVAEAFDQVLAADPDIERFSTYVGQGAIRFYLPLDVALPNDFFAQSVVVTKGLEQREQVRARLEQALATRFPQVVARVYPLELGPPVGWPVKYRVSGPDPQRARAIALQVADVLGAAEGVRNVNFDWVEPARVMRIRIDQDQARQLGLSSQDVATRAERRRDRHHGDAGARQHLSDRRGRARRTGTADIARIAPLAADLIAQRAGGAVAADRQLRLHAGIPDRLAARPRPDPDGAGRYRAGRVAGGRGASRTARASTSSRQPCRAATGSQPAVLSRRAANRRLR